MKWINRIFDPIIMLILGLGLLILGAIYLFCTGTGYLIRKIIF